MTDKCPICLEELRSSIGTIIPCGHCLHVECFEKLRNANGKNDHTSKLPRCPVCKHKSKKFVNLFLAFDDGAGQECQECPSSTAGTTSNGSGTPRNRGCYEEATEAVRSLASENFRLQKSLRELQSLSKDQSELLLEILPKLEDLESRLGAISEEKLTIEKELRLVEEENAELISDWNEVEMKMQLLKAEKNELKRSLRESMRENSELSMRHDVVDQKLAKARRKRKRIETALHEGLVNQERQAQELDDVKSQIHQSQNEKENLSDLLQKSQSETMKLKREVKRLKNKKRSKKKNICSSSSRVQGGKRRQSNSKTDTTFLVQLQQNVGGWTSESG